MKNKNISKAVFLDRDGTINIEKHHLYKIEDWEWIPGAIDAIKGFNNLGYLVIVVTNQSGVARGLYTIDDINRLHDYVNKTLDEEGAKINGWYYCPHHPDFGEEKMCNCRKPKPGLILKAKSDFNIDLSSSFTIGDKASDIEAGYKAGTTPILVKTGYGKEELNKISKNTLIVKDLLSAYQIVKKIYASNIGG